MKKGLSLTELLVALAIICILTSVLLPSVKYFTDLTQWADSAKAIENQLKLAKSESINGYAGLRFYFRGNEQYIQIVRVNSNDPYYSKDTKVLLLSEAPYEECNLSKYQRAFFTVAGAKFNIYPDLTPFYIMFKNRQIYIVPVIYKDDTSPVISTKYVSLKTDKKYSIYTVNQYTPSLIPLDSNSYNLIP